jgi:hypothetical protein
MMKVGYQQPIIELYIFFEIGNNLLANKVFGNQPKGIISGYYKNY